MLSRNSDNFRQFVENMDSLLRSTEEIDGRSQRKLLDDLFSLESKFKKKLMSTEHGPKIYRTFMDFILKEGSDVPEGIDENYVPLDKEDKMAFLERISEENGNILRARIYFRERQEVFSERVAQAFHKNRSEMLHRFRINYEFVMWVMERYRGPQKRALASLTEKIIETRKILCENNLPLAINRAKLFWSKIPESSLEYMDLIQASSEGLITAIDKFVPPYRTVFRTTAIGRMTLNMSTDHSATLLKLSPKDKRILYRARKAKGVEKITSEEEILKYVQQSFPNVTKEYLAQILSAAATSVALDHKQDGSVPLAEKISDQSIHPEERVVANDLYEKLSDGLSELEIRELKIVKLKNGDI